MRYQDNILYLYYDELVPELLSESNYKKLKANETITVIGRGGNGREVLVHYDSLPLKYRLLVQAKYGNPYEHMAKAPLLEKYNHILNNNDMARRYFESVFKGRTDSADHVIKCVKAASLLDTITQVMEDKKWIKRELNISLDAFWNLFYSDYKWKEGADGKRIKVGIERKGIIDALDIDLPASDQLKKKWRKYKEEGYHCLINGRFGNDFSRKVDESLERLILSLYAKPDPKPYAGEVCLQYLSFLEGKLQIVDLLTGELHNREDFYRNGEPLVLSEATVKHYLNKPANRLLVDKVRISGLEYSGKHRPHAHRKAPVYTLSKISMDDIAVPFKMPDGTRVWSYQIFEVASQAVIGVAFSRDKSQELVRNAALDMMRLLVRNDWGVPAEIEVEQHLNSGMKGSVNEDGEFTPDLLTEGNIFPFVRFCRGANPREKRAEGMIKGKKYGFQAKRKGFQYRPFARLEANRMNADADKVVYTYAEIIQHEREDIAAYNNAPHPDTDKYPGLTRWQVLEQHRNPNLTAPNLAIILPYVGQYTETSIRRNQYVRVKYNNYVLPDPEIVAQFTTGEIAAYYLPDQNDNINEVYLYQGGAFKCVCQRLIEFQEAQIERTAEDTHIEHGQLAYIKKFDTMVRRRKESLAKVATVRTDKSYQPEDNPEIKSGATCDAVPVQGGLRAENEAADSADHWWLNDEELDKRALKNI